MTYPFDDETGAEVPSALFETILSDGVDACIYVVGPADGHPNDIHERFGGSEIASYRRSLVKELRRRALDGRVFRVTANDFVTLSPVSEHADFVFAYRDVETRIRIRTFGIREKPG